MRPHHHPVLASLGRGSGVAGAVAALAGVLAVVALALPWHEATAELAMLGVAEDRAVATIPGWSTVAGWVAAVSGAVAVGLGVALAIDRHPGWTRPCLLAATAALVVSGLVAQLRRPTLERFPDGAGAVAELRAVAGDLPRGVELTLAVRPGPAAVAALVAGLTLLVAVAAARDLDQR
ncbi:MAG: hypothetical protein WEB03_14975 [Nitriliruptor sp.]|uniref:hypothetical protein n=1 Tax=Nitriliruptor sp. TaxID=2448056 RepID=UPI0034A076A9